MDAKTLRASWLSLVLFAAGCGGETPAPEVPEESVSATEQDPKSASNEAKSGAEAASEEEDADEPTSLGVPTQCASKEGVCVPGDKWVKRLCADVYAGVALYMFRKGTPWQRLYLRGKTEAVNASGGASVAGFLEFDEEVLVLRHRPTDKDGIQIGDGSGSYDALRWNGSCVSLEGGEVTTQRPPKPKHSRIEWRWLGPDVREALRGDEKVLEVFRARQKECKGVTMGAVSKKCEKLDEKLVDTIADYVRNGGDLPEPAERP